MKQLIIKCSDRPNDDVGKYLFESLLPAAKELDVTLVRVPCDKLYKQTPMEPSEIEQAAELEVDFINSNTNDDTIGFLFFSYWGVGDPVFYEAVSRVYDRIRCPIVFWTREDPNHYDFFLHDAGCADVICTSAKECVTKYKKEFLDKKVICTPMAFAPEIFYSDMSRKSYWDREYDLVFLGNRYPESEIRIEAEKAVIIPAAEWAQKNGKTFVLCGLQEGSFSWESLELPGVIFRDRTGRLEAAEYYRNAKVALSIALNKYSRTMVPNRVPQILASGASLIAYDSFATMCLSGGYANMSYSALETKLLLDEIFFSSIQKHFDKREKACEYVHAHHTFTSRLEIILKELEKC